MAATIPAESPVAEVQYAADGSALVHLDVGPGRRLYVKVVPWAEAYTTLANIAHEVARVLTTALPPEALP